LVMEYASGGELFTQVANGGAMSEDRARSYFKQIVSAASHCHSQDICHRDLKLENVLLGADERTVKITDFGLSKDTEQHSQPKTKRVGTISYMAPEVAMASGESPYSGVAADVWSLGVILYVLVCCEYPFGFDGAGGQPTQRVLTRIKEGTFTFPTDKVPLSPEIMSLIQGILNVNLDERFTIADILVHPWYTAGEVREEEAGSLKSCSHSDS
jgi:serine/threonine-protein kinase SRK2